MRFVKIINDSMFPEYLEGDVVEVLETPKCESGNDVLVKVGDAEPTLKRLIIKSDGILLKSLNPEYQTRFFSNEEVKELPVQILGVAVKLIRKID